MPSLQLKSLRDLRDKIGQEIVTSDWLEITQQSIDQFAEATGDRQWIHVDVERARRESPFGAPVAHGFLTVSMPSRLLGDSIDFGPARLGVNYGFNRLRFTGPVRRIPLARPLHPEQPGNRRRCPGHLGVLVEREGSEKPCLVAEWLTRRYD
jgi:hypothetical protein